MRFLLAILLIGLGIAFLLWEPWKPADSGQIESPRPIPAAKAPEAGPAPPDAPSRDSGES